MEKGKLREKAGITGTMLVKDTGAAALSELNGAVAGLFGGVVIARYLGENAMAAYGLTIPYFTLISMFTGILSVGYQSPCSKALGAGDREGLAKIVSTVLILVIALSAVLTAGGLLLAGPLSRLLGASGENSGLYKDLRSYTVGWFIGVPAMIAQWTLTPFVLLDGNRKCSVASGIVQAVTAILASFLFVKVFGMGMFGAGLAVAVDFYAGLLVLLTDFFRKETMFPLRLCGFDRSVFHEMFAYGLPRFTQDACQTAEPVLVNRGVLQICRTPAMTAMSVVGNLQDFFLCFGVGLSDSVRTIAQILFSERDSNGLLSLVKCFLAVFAAGGSVLAAILFFFARGIAGIYLSETAAGFPLAVSAVRAFAVFVPLRTFVMCVTNYVHASGDMVMAHRLNFLDRFVFPVFIIIGMGGIFGIKGLFAGLPAAEACTILYYFLKTAADKAGKTYRDALLKLPEIPEGEKSMKILARETSEVSGISEAVQTFCMENGIDKRRAYFGALSVEELAGNAVRHRDERETGCDITVVTNDGDLTIRLRDDCGFFDIAAWYSLMKDSPRTDNIGIRLVYSMAKEVIYIPALGTNTIIITI